MSADSTPDNPYTNKIKDEPGVYLRASKWARQDVTLRDRHASNRNSNFAGAVIDGRNYMIDHRALYDLCRNDPAAAGRMREI